MAVVMRWLPLAALGAALLGLAACASGGTPGRVAPLPTALTAGQGSTLAESCAGFLDLSHTLGTEMSEALEAVNSAPDDKSKRAGLDLVVASLDNARLAAEAQARLSRDGEIRQLLSALAAALNQAAAELTGPVSNPGQAIYSVLSSQDIAESHRDLYTRCENHFPGEGFLIN
jgi:hypothetical protein